MSFQFSLRDLLVAVACIAVACTALWTLLMALLGDLVARWLHRSEERRAASAS